MKRYSQHIAKATLALATIFTLNGCNDDLSWNFFDPEEDGVIAISLSVPQPTKITTRSADLAAERQIDALDVFIYDKDGKLVQHEAKNISNKTDGVIPENGLTSLPIILNAKAKEKNDDGGLKVVVVANAASKFTSSDATTIGNGVDKITAIKDDGDLMAEGHKFIMSGKTSAATKLSAATPVEVNMVRTAAKFSATLDASVSNFSFTAIQVRSTAEEGYVAAGMEDSAAGGLYASTSSKVSGTCVDEEYVYSYPTKYINGATYNPFIIVRGTYNSNPDNYYKIELKTKKENTDPIEYEYLNIRPNHEYEVLIKSVTGPGYASADLAAKSEPANMDAEIVDHAPSVFSMASDGMRELGVTGDMLYEGSANATNDWSNLTMAMRLVSRKTSEQKDLFIKSQDGNTIVFKNSDGAEEAVVKITEGASWLDIQCEYDEKTGKAGTIGSGETDGLFSLKLGFRATDQTGVKDGVISVTWKGLERKVKVRWEEKFNPKSLCQVELIIHKEDNPKDTYNITDYWTFLAGDGTGTDSKSVTSNGVTTHPKLYGTGLNDNCKRVRNQGFHFPVMYGSGSKKEDKWWYEYKLTFQEGFTPSDIKLTDNTYCKLEGSGNSYTLTPNSKGDPWEWAYTQSTKLTFTAKDQEFSWDIYHTGFFHYDSTSKDHLKGNGSASGSACYYYYEVISMADRHWLDRNIGATACGMNILGSDGKPIVKKDENPFFENSKGGYYKVADYKEYEYASTKLYTAALCPPGYRFPSTNEWDKVRNSSQFVTGMMSHGGATFYAAYYNTTLPNDENGDNLKVYFPKVRYTNNFSMTGESNAGYYWTKNDAYGLEKLEIGKWLQTLMLSGASNSFMHGHAQNYGMSLRCVADEKDEESNKVTSFNVTGATHVFLYTENADGTKNGIYQWPGKAIGDAKTMLTNTFNFVYSSAYDSDKLYVLFNYVDNDGSIYTMSNNSYTSDAEHLNMGLLNAKGWQVVNTKKKDVIKAAHGVDVSDLKGTGDEAETQIGSTWTCLPYGYEPDGYTFHLCGESPFGSWSPGKTMSYDLKHKVWTTRLKIEKGGAFGIGKFKGTDQEYWIWSPNTEESHKVVLDKFMKTIEQDQNPDNGKNWTDLLTGTYTFTYNDKDNTLYISTSDEIPSSGGITVPESYSLYGSTFGTNGTIGTLTLTQSGNLWTARQKCNYAGYLYVKHTNTDGSVTDLKGASSSLTMGTPMTMNGSSLVRGLTQYMTYDYSYNSSTNQLTVNEVEYTVTYTNPEGWSEVCAYVWCSNDNGYHPLGDWPGTKMTKSGNVYTITFKSKADKIIFNNNNSGQQTADLNVVDNKEYTDKKK